MIENKEICPNTHVKKLNSKSTKLYTSKKLKLSDEELEDNIFAICAGGFGGMNYHYLLSHPSSKHKKAHSPSIRKRDKTTSHKRAGYI